MDFGLSEQQQKWHDAAVRFARDELVDAESVAREQRGEFCARVTNGAGDSEFSGCPFPASTAARAPTSRRRSRPWKGLATDAPTPA